MKNKIKLMLKTALFLGLLLYIGNYTTQAQGFDEFGVDDWEDWLNENAEDLGIDYEIYDNTNVAQAENDFEVYVTDEICDVYPELCEGGSGEVELDEVLIVAELDCSNPNSSNYPCDPDPCPDGETDDCTECDTDGSGCNPNPCPNGETDDCTECDTDSSGCGSVSNPNPVNCPTGQIPDGNGGCKDETTDECADKGQAKDINGECVECAEKDTAGKCVPCDDGKERLADGNCATKCEGNKVRDINNNCVECEEKDTSGKCVPCESDEKRNAAGKCVDDCTTTTGYLWSDNFVGPVTVGEHTMTKSDNFRDSDWNILSDVNCDTGKIQIGNVVNVLSATSEERTLANGTKLNYYKVSYKNCEGNNKDNADYDPEKPCSDCAEGNPSHNLTILGSCNNGIVGGLYGYGRGRHHDGIDLLLDEGTPVYAMFDGTVGLVNNDHTEGEDWTNRSTWTGDRNAAGNRIYVSSSVGSDTLQFGYWHLSNVAINPDTGVEYTTGDLVEQGDVVGYVGTTGNANSTSSSGPHLHLRGRKNGAYYNPEDSFKATIDHTDGTSTIDCN